MAKVFIEETTLTSIGDAIRGKEGTTALIPVNDMATRISAIETGGGGGIEPPEEALNITGNCQYRFSNGSWDWFIDGYGHKIQTNGITNLSNFMTGSQVRALPFDINVSNVTTLTNAFKGMTLLRTCPRIRGTMNMTTNSFDGTGFVENCNLLTDLEDLFDVNELGDGFNTVKVTSSYSCPKAVKLSYCGGIRHVPSWVPKFIHSETSTAAPISAYTIYGSQFSHCFTLDEIVDYPVLKYAAACTSNMFAQFLNYTHFLKRFTFETDNGQPIVASWKAQVLDFSNYTGYKAAASNIFDKINGITSDKKVTDDASYQALKDDPNWYSENENYSKYTHASAVETINSLPDTSAYLASAGGTNTIKFEQMCGYKTDDKAIMYLTAEEIAVATAKGWTVSLV